MSLGSCSWGNTTRRRGTILSDRLGAGTGFPITAESFAMQRFLLSICIAMLGVGHASAVEFTHTLTPQLADVQAARLFVYASPGSFCDIPKTKMVAVAKQTLRAAGMSSVDGLDPDRTTWPILEIDIDALELLRKCYLTLKIILRVGVTGPKVEGDQSYEYEMVWGDVVDYMCVPSGFVYQVSELLRSRLRLMIADIARARAKYPDL